MLLDLLKKSTSETVPTMSASQTRPNQLPQVCQIGSFFFPFRKRRLCHCMKRIWYSALRSVEYNCEKGVTISNHHSRSTVKQGVNARMRSIKFTYLNELDVRKPLVVCISQMCEELRLYNLV
jgi:hypothetical protein